MTLSVVLCKVSLILNVIMLSVANKPLMLGAYAECRYAECCYVECCEAAVDLG